MSDLISRQAAIDRFEPWLKVKGYNEGELNMLKAVLYELKCLPSADKDRWIPCSERLPEKPKPNPDLDGKPLDLYLVCAKGDTPFRAFWNGKTFTDGWFCLTPEVDAWMPLPEPFVEDKNE